MAIKDRDWRMLAAVALCGIVVVVCGLWTLRAARGVSSSAPAVEMKMTETAIEEIRREAADVNRGIEERAKKVREKIVSVRRDEANGVAELSPDAVAVGVADELRLFLRGAGSGDCLSICP
ncbi:hypothetical protein [Cloacibacillus evryensis]|uniref:hypothetical protein n=1 Tax=Cloacibacillus evryensis TaxID=508460 RepID=UPI00241DC6B4|nr:hypothetical protein [Cloacibacillus evryensis]